MDESIVRVFEEQKVGTLKLSDAIRVGCAMSVSTKETGLKVWILPVGDRLCSCVFGAAWIGSGGSIDPYDFIGRIGSQWISERFGLPHDDAIRIHNAYESGEKTREELADYAESKGY